jgi:hypothetical protein
MVIHLVRDLRDAINEGDSVGESLENERFGERIATPRPAGQATERALNLEVGQFLAHRCEVVRVRERRYGSYRLRRRAAIRRVVVYATRTVLGVLLFANVARAQSADTASSPRYYWRHFSYGVVASILFHEAAHIATAMAVGGHPTFGFDKLRPTIFSGIDSHIAPHKQFLFSAAGLTAQTALDEAILDIPHARGSAFERGLLGGGIGTTLFYLTIGRQGTVSDVDFIARTHALTKTQVTLIYGGVAALHAIRISRNPSYANFFARGRPDGRTDVGIQFAAP